MEPSILALDRNNTCVSPTLLWTLNSVWRHVHILEDKRRNGTSAAQNSYDQPAATLMPPHHKIDIKAPPTPATENWYQGLSVWSYSLRIWCTHSHFFAFPYIFLAFSRVRVKPTHYQFLLFDVCYCLSCLPKMKEVSTLS